MLHHTIKSEKIFPAAGKFTFNLLHQEKFHLAPARVVRIFLEQKSKRRIALQVVVVEQIFGLDLGQRHQWIFIVLVALVAYVVIELIP